VNDQRGKKETYVEHPEILPTCSLFFYNNIANMFFVGHIILFVIRRREENSLERIGFLFL
jgi:hypothetical protein